MGASPRTRACLPPARVLVRRRRPRAPTESIKGNDRRSCPLLTLPASSASATGRSPHLNVPTGLTVSSAAMLPARVTKCAQQRHCVQVTLASEANLVQHRLLDKAAHVG